MAERDQARRERDETLLISQDSEAKKASKEAHRIIKNNFTALQAHFKHESTLSQEVVVGGIVS